MDDLLDVETYRRNINNKWLFINNKWLFIIDFQFVGLNRV